jgi:hypothetical protein
VPCCFVVVKKWSQAISRREEPYEEETASCHVRLLRRTVALGDIDERTDRDDIGVHRYESVGTSALPRIREEVVARKGTLSGGRFRHDSEHA